MNETSAPIAEARSRWTRRKAWFFVAFAALGVIAVVASVYYFNAGPKPPGDELQTGEGSYGWKTSKDVGTIFTDGLNLISLTPRARGPLRLISAEPVMDDGGTVRVIGIQARIMPDMKPPDSHVGGVQQSPGFPPTNPGLAGAVPVEGLVAQPPKQGEQRWIEIQIGYEVVAPGRSERRGIELVYEYEGSKHKALIPSYVAYCAPSTASCAQVAGAD